MDQQVVVLGVDNMNHIQINKDQKSVIPKFAKGLNPNVNRQKVHSDLDEAADIDYKLFWKLINEQKPKKRTVCNEIVRRW